VPAFIFGAGDGARGVGGRQAPTHGAACGSAGRRSARCAPVPDDGHELVHALRREQRKRVPICNSPTRVGKPCQADAITYPVPIEACRIHLTAEETAMLADAEG
jgi:hypothetical protein